MFSSSAVKRCLGTLLFGTVLVAGDIPARLQAIITTAQPQGLVALAQDGGDGGDSDSDSDGDSDADADDGDTADADDSDDEADADDAEDADDDARRTQGGSAAHGAGDHLVQRRRPVRTVRHAARPAAIRAAGELVASGLDERALASLTAEGYRIVRRERLGAAGGTLVKLRVPRRMSLEQARGHVASASPRSAIDFNHYYRPDSEEVGKASPCAVVGCFAVELIGWPQARTQAVGCGQGVRIGLIDTAINADHPALSGHHLEVIRLEQTKALPESGRQHGTAVASLFLGAAGSRSPGLLPGSEVIAIDAFHRGQARDERADVFDLVRSLDMLGERGVQAINMSLSGPPNELLKRAVARLKAKNIVLVAAAGNKGPHAEPLYPAAYDGVIAVTAIDRGKAIYRHANQGDYIDFAAPGVDVWTAASIKGARRKTGTSFATPFVTAVAAVVAARNPHESPTAVQDLMASVAEDLGKPGRDPVFGWGLVNARDICSAEMKKATH